MWVHAKPAAVIFIGFGLCAHAAQMAHTAQAAQKAKPAVELADRFAAPAEQARNEDAEAAERKRDPDSESAPKANSEPPGADYEAELLDRARRELLREQAKRAGAESGKSDTVKPGDAEVRLGRILERLEQRARQPQANGPTPQPADRTAKARSGGRVDGSDDARPTDRLEPETDGAPQKVRKPINDEPTRVMATPPSSTPGKANKPQKQRPAVRAEGQHTGEMPDVETSAPPETAAPKPFARIDQSPFVRRSAQPQQETEPERNKTTRGAPLPKHVFGRPGVAADGPKTATNPGTDLRQSTSDRPNRQDSPNRQDNNNGYWQTRPLPSGQGKDATVLVDRSQDSGTGPENPKRLARPDRVTVILAMEPGNRGIRRFNKTGDPILCVGQTCFISQGADRSARRMSRRRAFGTINTLGKRAGACRNQLVCVFRGVRLPGGRAAVQPIDLRVMRHDRREITVVKADPGCRVRNDRLTCPDPVISQSYVLWVVSETTAQAVGPRRLELAARFDLKPQHAAARD